MRDGLGGYLGFLCILVLRSFRKIQFKTVAGPICSAAMSWESVGACTTRLKRNSDAALLLISCNNILFRPHDAPPERTRCLRSSLAGAADPRSVLLAGQSSVALS